jgi:hypothetical protein
MDGPPAVAVPVQKARLRESLLWNEAEFTPGPSAVKREVIGIEEFEIVLDMEVLFWPHGMG